MRITRVCLPNLLVSLSVIFQRSLIFLHLCFYFIFSFLSFLHTSFNSCRLCRLFFLSSFPLFPSLLFSTLILYLLLTFLVVFPPYFLCLLLSLLFFLSYVPSFCIFLPIFVCPNSHIFAFIFFPFFLFIRHCFLLFCHSLIYSFLS